MRQESEKKITTVMWKVNCEFSYYHKVSYKEKLLSTLESVLKSLLNIHLIIFIIRFSVRYQHSLLFIVIKAFKHCSQIDHSFFRTSPTLTITDQT
jgi:hypothetical protein